MCGNRFVSGGKVGERKRTNGEIYEDDDQLTNTPAKRAGTDMATLGCSIHTEEAIKYVTYRHKYVSDACDNSDIKGEEWKRLRQEVSEKSIQFSASRISVKTDDFKNKFNIERKQNVIQRRKGVDITPFMQGKVPYGKLRMDHDWENLKIELVHRNLSTDGNWTACVKRLTNHEQGDKKNFKILSSATFPWH